MDRKQFVLDKLKFLNEKVDIAYHHTVMVDNAPKVLTDNPVSPIQPSEGFREALNELRNRIVEVFYPKKMREQMYHKVSVHGFQISGDEDKKVKLFGKMECNAGYTISLNTPWINLVGNEGVYQMEEILEANIDLCIDKAYSYLFEGEKAQYDIPFDNTAKEEKTENKTDEEQNEAKDN